MQRRRIGSFWVVATLCGAITMAPIGITAYIVTAPAEVPKVDPARYPGYDRVCDTGVVERSMDGGGPVRYWGPDATSPDCLREGEDPFRKALPRALYVTPDKLSSMAIPPGDWVVQIQPGLFVSNIPPERRAAYTR
jgi:hypothetical protein